MNFGINIGSRSATHDTLITIAWTKKMVVGFVLDMKISGVPITSVSSALNIAIAMYFDSENSEDTFLAR